MTFGTRVAIVLSALAVNAAVALPRRFPDPELYDNAEPTYEILKFSLWTRAGYCSQHGCPQLTKGLEFPPWTIHSLQPLQKDGKTGPASCANAKFNEADVQTIRQNLERDWRSLTSDFNKTLWEQQFNKYGVCALSEEYGLNSTLAYFQRALDLYRVENVYPLLNINGIEPNDNETMALVDINNAIRGNIYAVDYFCEGQRNSTDILQEVRLCFNPATSQRISCPPVPEQNSTCKSDMVWYLRSSGVLATPTTLLMITTMLVALFSRN